MHSLARLARHPLSAPFGLAAGLSLGLFAQSGLAGASAEPPAEHRGLAVETLGVIPAPEIEAMVGLKDHFLQLRAITIAPDGQIARHSHADRPGLVKVVSGTWIEGRESGESAFEPDGSDAIIEDREADHWFFNRGDEPATAIVCDLNPATD